MWIFVFHERQVVEPRIADVRKVGPLRIDIVEGRIDEKQRSPRQVGVLLLFELFDALHRDISAFCCCSRFSRNSPQPGERLDWTNHDKLSDHQLQQQEHRQPL